VGCAGATDVGACVRGASTAALRDAGGFTGNLLPLVAGSNRATWPTPDGTILPGSFRQRVEAGDVADVPVILGWNRDEGTLFLALATLDGTVIDEAAYHSTIATLGATYGLDPAVIEAQYPLSGYPDPAAALAAPLGHVAVACPQRRAALLLASHGIDVRTYHFEYPDARFAVTTAIALGAFHTAEIQFIFGHPAGARTFPDDAATALSESIRGYWGSFVRAGDPNTPGAAEWPRFDATSEPTLVLDRTIANDAAIDRAPCALWDTPLPP